MRSSRRVSPALVTVLVVVLMSFVFLAAGCSSAEEDTAVEDSGAVESAPGTEPTEPETYATADEAVASVLDLAWVYELDEYNSGEEELEYFTGPEMNRWLEKVYVESVDDGSWRVSSVDTDGDRGPDWEESRWAAGWNDPEAYPYPDNDPAGAAEFVKDYLRCVSNREFDLAAKRLTEAYASTAPWELSPDDEYLEPWGNEWQSSLESNGVILVEYE
ncbi:MAG: hypothetical protein PF636_00575 [Actinomycetota bacterium]|nr:hypothetical protein [Actinomycetota bacterium]